MSGDHNMHCSANTGGPAFPQNTKIMLPAGQEVHQGFMGGMTLRDYFAEIGRAHV